MSRILSVLYRKLIIEPGLEVLVIFAFIYAGYFVAETIVGDMPLVLLIPILLLAGFMLYKLRGWNSPRQLAVWLALGLSLASCGKDNPQSSRNAADLTIHAASDEAAPGWNVMKFWDAGGGEIWIEPTAVLNLNDIQSAEQTRDEMARTAIAIRLTGPGSEKMRQFTSANIGKKAAIVFEGKVMNAPVIMSEIGSNAIITTGPGLSGEQAERILAMVNQ